MAPNPAIIDKLNALYDAKAAEVAALASASQSLTDSTTAATNAQTAAKKADDLTAARKKAESDFVSALQADLDPPAAPSQQDATQQQGAGASAAGAPAGAT